MNRNWEGYVSAISKNRGDKNLFTGNYQCFAYTEKFVPSYFSDYQSECLI